MNTEQHVSNESAIKEAKEIYERFRRRIVEEDGVINHRMMWGTLSQTALFAGFGIANLETINLTRLLFCVIIAVIGATTATLTLLAIKAAHSEIRSLVRSYGDIETADYCGKLSIIGSGLHHQHGHMLCVVLPWLMAPFWILAGLYVSLKYFRFVF